MGSTFISRSSKGYNIDETFTKIQQADARMYGEDYYSGHFGSTFLRGGVKVFNGVITDDTREKVRAILYNEQDNGSCYSNGVLGIDMGIVEYEVITVKKKPIKKTENTKPKWEQYYKVYDGDRILFESNDKKLATDKLLTFAITHHNVELVKEPKLVKGNSVECGVTVSVKKSKTKPTRVPKNAVVKEVHEYVFYGWVKE